MAPFSSYPPTRYSPKFDRVPGCANTSPNVGSPLARRRYGTKSSAQYDSTCSMFTWMASTRSLVPGGGTRTIKDNRSGSDLVRHCPRSRERWGTSESATGSRPHPGARESTLKVFLRNAARRPRLLERHRAGEHAAARPLGAGGRRRRRGPALADRPPPARGLPGRRQHPERHRGRGAPAQTATACDPPRAGRAPRRASPSPRSACPGSGRGGSGSRSAGARRPS